MVGVTRLGPATRSYLSRLVSFLLPLSLSLSFFFAIEFTSFAVSHPVLVRSKVIVRHGRCDGRERSV